MNEIITTLSKEEMGSRLQKVRLRLEMTQSQVASEVGTTLGAISRIERGEIVHSNILYAVLAFYSKSISMDVLFAGYFDIDAPELFSKKNPALDSFVKAHLEKLESDAKQQIQQTQDGFKKNVGEALDKVHELLFEALNSQMRENTQDTQDKLMERLNHIIKLL